MIRKTSVFTHTSPCLPLKIFKLLNKREERSNNAAEMLVALVGFVEIILLIYLIAGVLDNFLNLSRDF